MGFVRSRGVRLSSQRTYANWLLGQMARRQSWRALDEGRILKAGLLLQDLRREANRVAPRQCKPALVETLLRTATAVRAHLLGCFLLCARLGDFVRNARTLRARHGTLAMDYAVHKTVGVIGPKKVSLVVPEDLRPYMIFPRTRPSLQTLQQALKDLGLSQHSLRRGGVQYWKAQGKTDTEIAQLTLHVSHKNYLRYISTITETRVLD